MLKKIASVVASAVVLIGCGTVMKEPITSTGELERDRRQSAGNSSLATSLLEAKPPVDLNITHQ